MKLEHYEWRPFPREFLMEQLMLASHESSSLAEGDDRLAVLDSPVIQDTRNGWQAADNARWIRTNIHMANLPDCCIWVPVVLLKEIKPTAPDYSIDSFPDDF